MLVCRDGEDSDILKLLVGLCEKGLAARSVPWLIVEGLRTKGLVFSGESEELVGRVGVKLPVLVLALVGDCVGVAAGRTVGAGEALFWRLKGDCLPEDESKESGEGR